MDKLNEMISDPEQRDKIMGQVNDNPQLKEMIGKASENPEQLQGILSQVQGQTGGSGEEGAEGGVAEGAEGDAEKKAEGGGGAWYTKPRGIGDSAGSAIQSGLSPVGKPLGTGLGYVGKPVGGLVEPLVGGVMKGASAWGDMLNVGAGNMEHKDRAAEEEAKRRIGGQEQNAENPLGL